MTKEVVDYVLSLLGEGEAPVFKLHPRKGRDVRLMRIDSSDRHNFYGVLIDTPQNQSVILPHISVIHGTIWIEEVKEEATV